MIISEREIEEKYPKSFAEFKIFLDKNAIECVSASVYIYFLDSKKLFIGITTMEGTDYLIELNGIMVEIKDTRELAEDYAIREMFQILEKTI